MYVDATIMISFQTEQFSRFLLPTYTSHVKLARQSLGGACQSSKMVALLNSLSFVFNTSFLPKYRVKYYDCIVKW